jgi:hypothetical protein
METEKRDMGTQKQQKLERRDAKRSVTRRAMGVADWESADSDLLKRAVAIVSSRGGALRFGYTRDGGAYAIGILGDGDPYTEYLRPTDDIDEYLRALIEIWNE